MSESERKKVPFLVILAKALDRWRLDHGGAGPKSSAEQLQIRETIEKEAKQLPEEENYTEALAYIGNIFRPANHISDEVKEAMDLADTVESKEQFWVCVRALKRFIEEHKRCPLS